METRRCWLVLFFKFYFQKNHWKKQPFRKYVLVNEELDCTYINDIGDLEDSPKLVFITYEFENLMVINDSEELITKIKQNIKSDVLQQPIDWLNDKYCRRENFFSNHLEYLLWIS